VQNHGLYIHSGAANKPCKRRCNQAAHRRAAPSSSPRRAILKGRLVRTIRAAWFQVDRRRWQRLQACSDRLQVSEPMFVSGLPLRVRRVAASDRANCGGCSRCESSQKVRKTHHELASTAGHHPSLTGGSRRIHHRPPLTAATLGFLRPHSIRGPLIV
jgi:hypothetical protein